MALTMRYCAVVVLPAVLVVLASSSSSAAATAACSSSSSSISASISRCCALRTPSSSSRRKEWRRGRLISSVPFLTTVTPTSAASRQRAADNLRWQRRRLLLSLRGGDEEDEEEEEEEEDNEDEEYEEEDDEEEEDEDDDDFASYDDDGVADSDFDEDSWLGWVLQEWEKTPPFTKTYLTASLGATVYGFLFCQNQFPPMLAMEWTPILKKLQFWRLFTSFLNVGPFGLGWFLTGHFVWQYMATLERLNYNKPYDFWIMILFGQMALVGGYPLLKMSPKFLGHNLSTFLVYVWSRYHEGLEVTLFEMFTTRAELLPWVFLAQTFLLEGEPPVLDFLGIVLGHVYHHYYARGMLRAPDALVRWYNKSDADMAVRIRNGYKEIKGEFELD